MNFWKFSLEYEIFVYKGSDPNEAISPIKSISNSEIISEKKENPKPQVTVHHPKSVEIT